jgi:hypothetical protein
MRISVCALRWSEGRLEEANAEWEKADAFASQMHACGYAEWERHAVQLMREALDGSMAPRAAEAVEVASVPAASFAV